MGSAFSSFHLFTVVMATATLGAASIARAADATATPAPPPNIVIVFTDDLGYADIGVFGAKGYRTPHLDKLAADGRVFRNFHVAQPVCSASRAGLQTGCYPNRIGIHGALGPRSKVGLHDGEMTLGEMARQRGYATALFGKWHLGDAPRFLPVHHGYDEYYGLPYSNDMWPRHPDLVNADGSRKKQGYPELPLIEGDRAAIPVVMPEHQAQLTTWYTERAVRFIENHRAQPFLLVVAHNMPHVPLYVSDKFRGKTARGLFGDVIAEIDWSVGQIVEALDRTGLRDNTWVIFTSDNGPWLSYGDHAGSALPLREGKGTSWEGGTRVPCVMRWPGRIPAGSESRDMLMTIDLLPTIAGRIGATLPPHPIDGLDVWPLVCGQPGARNPHEAYWMYYARGQLQAVISGDGRWKLVLPHAYPSLNGRPGGSGGRPARYDQVRLAAAALYDLANDVSESTDVADKHPATVALLMSQAETARAELGDALTKRTGRGLRPAGTIP